MSEKKGLLGGLFGGKKKSDSCGTENAEDTKGCGCAGGSCAEENQAEAVAGAITLKVLGTGCAKCNKLEENVREAIAGMEQSYHVVKVTEVTDIAALGVMVTPALMVGKRIVSTGKVLKPDEIKEILNKRS